MCVRTIFSHLWISPTHRLNDFIPLEQWNFPCVIRQYREQNLPLVYIENLPEVSFVLGAIFDLIFYLLHCRSEVHIMIQQREQHNNHSKELYFEREAGFDLVWVGRNEKKFLVLKKFHHELTPIYGKIKEICSTKYADESVNRLTCHMQSSRRKCIRALGGEPCIKEHLPIMKNLKPVFDKNMNKSTSSRAKQSWMMME